MKSLAREYVWWPKIDKDIELMVRKCTHCALVQQNPAKIIFNWEPAQKVWERVHADFAGPFKDFMWLIVVDFGGL